MKTKICPKCGSEHAITVDYCGCGHKWKRGSVEQAEHYADPMHGCCEVSSSAGRCHYPGSINNATTGGGQWICRNHYMDTDGVHTDYIIEASHHDHPNADYSIEARRQNSLKALRADLMLSKHISPDEKKRIANGINAMVKRYTVEI